MPDLTFDDLMPPDLESRTREEAARGRVPFVILRPDKGPASPPQPIGIVFAPSVPRVGETLLWENGETYAITAVTYRLWTDTDAPPYLTAMPLLSTMPVKSPERAG